jgi:hypothetical protein
MNIGMLAQAYNPSTQEDPQLEARLLSLKQEEPQLEASLYYIDRPCLKNTKINT